MVTLVLLTNSSIQMTVLSLLAYDRQLVSTKIELDQLHNRNVYENGKSCSAKFVKTEQHVFYDRSRVTLNFATKWGSLRESVFHISTVTSHCNG